MNTGKADWRWENTSEKVPSLLPGYWRRHASIGDQPQHGKPPAVIRNRGSTCNSREIGWAARGDGEARSTEEAG